MLMDMPPSPRDPKISALGAASVGMYLVAAFCAWNIGGWWGIGLVGSLFILNTIDEFVHEEHRQELVQLQGRLIARIAENSEIMNGVFPYKEGKESDSDSP